MLSPDDLRIADLGEPRFPSPLVSKKRVTFCDDSRIVYQQKLGPRLPPLADLSFEEAGPRTRIFFDPAKTSAAIVTCGGLSPGLNNVVRSAFLELRFNYGVPRVLGIRNGYMGLNPASGIEPVELALDFVDHIHHRGGTVLGSSRGAHEPAVMVEFLRTRGIDILFCVGGEGTQRGAHALALEVQRRGLPIAVVGIPKTIDNDIPFVAQSFGYETALSVAAEALNSAHTEARGAPNGIGVVKLMGRDAGFIAAGAAVASQDANFVLIPEIPFPLEGEDGFLAALQRRIEARNHALVVVAEGAGQHLFDAERRARDASGNLAPHDIGPFLCARIREHFARENVPINLKYIDPSYLIRAVPAIAGDRILCDWMGRYAVHAGMAGKTDLFIGSWSDELIHVPLPLATSNTRRLDLDGDLWNAVLGCTGQPHW